MMKYIKLVCVAFGISAILCACGKDNNATDTGNTNTEKPTITIIDDKESEDVVQTPGPDIVNLVNLRGDETTAYKLVDGTYMDQIDRRFTFNGTDAWFEDDGVEWNEKVE